jgi:hypothetical protein
VALLTVVGGCISRETHARYPEDLHHPDYVKRTKAVAEFAQRLDRSQMPDAFRLLLDDDANIRLVAYEAIRQMSPGGEDFGYRPYLPQDVRFGVVSRWQTWWERNGGEPAIQAEEPKAPEEPPEPSEPPVEAEGCDAHGGEAVEAEAKDG